MNISDPSIIALVVLFAQVTGRAIPDSAGGILGFVRKLAKIVGLYVKNQE